MGKRYYKSKCGDTRILFKKSNTICTQSRTCSGASQFYTRSSILQHQKNLSQTNEYYVDSGKIKRDLSVETDVCILRRYYKSKLHKRDNSKSKYSTVITEIDSVKKFRHGACGDSKTTTKDNQQVDIAAMMVENLKGLLTNWIQKHLLENKDTQEKIETVLHSIIHKGREPKADKISSRSTYILSREGHNYEVKNKKVETASLICDYCNHKSRPITTNSSSNVKDLSSQSVPSPIKKLRVLSTLSIPRNIKVSKIKSMYKLKKIKHNKSKHSQSKLLDSSSFDLLAISTRSFTKRCVTYGMRRPKKRRIAFHSKPVHNNVSNTTETEEKEVPRAYKEVKKAELEDMPSLVKSIYADHPANLRPNNINRTPTSDTFTLTEKNNLKPAHLKDDNVSKDDKYTSKASFANTQTGRDQSEPMITIDFVSNSVEFPIEKEFEQITSRQDDGVNVSSKKNVYLSKRRRSLKLAKPRYTQNRKFTLSCNKDEYQMASKKELFNHVQNILKYITEGGSKGNFKLDIHVSVLPVKGKSVDMSSQISNISIRKNIIGTSIEGNTDKPIPSTESKQNLHTEIIINDVPEQTPDIIPILDGAASQAKYIFNTENSIKYEPVRTNVTADQGTKTSKLEIVQEIHDLKSVVKHLLHTAETLVSEQLKKETNKQRMSPHKSNNVKTIETIKTCKKPISQGIQISNDFAKNLPLAGIKLSKEPKRDTIEFCHRLMRKSTSYKIIESESVLRVTDMTVGGKAENSPEFDILPKSKSLIDVAKEKKNVIAYYCDASCNDSCCGRDNSAAFSKISLDRSVKSKKKQESRSSSSCECSRNHTHQPVVNDSAERIPECPTSVYIDIEECCDKNALMRHRKGMGFGEGFIYCLLLWIPVTIIACLFYNYVIKDLLRPSDKGGSKNTSMLHVKLSDLGF
ncbi:hypothetical protein O3G_MSEX003208 [Manduca sexta]|uniref:Uncharacterized protein n=1 Tax=Manduca sexta TaxID=7130 RepID=A0A921YRM8_MANSE|nr:hypothetical protein O3G_MSEX003208 [Manduca sexta]